MRMRSSWLNMIVQGAFRIRRVSSQLSVGFVESNGAFDVSAGIQNTNLTRLKARSGFRIVDCLTLLREHRLDPWRFKNFPSPRMRSNFDYGHRVWPAVRCIAWLGRCLISNVAVESWRAIQVRCEDSLSRSR